MVFLKLDNKGAISWLRFAVLLMVIRGAYTTVAVVFNMAAAAMGQMATASLITIVLLSGDRSQIDQGLFHSVPHRSSALQSATIPET